MNESFKEFNGRLDAKGIRFYNPEIANMSVFDIGYKEVIPSGKAQVPFFTLQRANSSLHVEDYMRCIGSPFVNGKETRVFEQDIVDYCVGNNRGVGVICYFADKFCYGIKDLKTRETYPLFKVQLNRVIGTIYGNSNLIDCDLEMAYKRLGKNVPTITSSTIEKVASEGAVVQEPKQEERKNVVQATSTIETTAAVATPKDPMPVAKNVLASTIEKTADIAQPAGTPSEGVKAPVDVYVKVEVGEDHIVSWKYKLVSGQNVKIDKKAFGRQGENDGYYNAAANVIALSNLKKPRPINLYTSDIIVDLIISGKLSFWATSGNWKKENGAPVKNASVLKELYDNIQRLGGNVTPIKLAS